MALSPHHTASNWLQSCTLAFEGADVDGLTRLFLPDGWLRDLLVFTWDFRSLAGRDKITPYLRRYLEKAQIKDVRLDESKYLSPRTFPEFANGQGVDFAFSFECVHGHGRAHVRIVPDTDGVFRAYTLLMQLEDLVVHEERSTFPLRDDVTGIPGRDMQREFAELVQELETRPHVLIGMPLCRFHSLAYSPTDCAVGGAQTGLQVAARCKQMNIPALVIERHARIGDTWRERYPTLTLHTARKQHSR